jgi:hypothetical protein
MAAFNESIQDQIVSESHISSLEKYKFLIDQQGLVNVRTSLSRIERSSAVDSFNRLRTSQPIDIFSNKNTTTKNTNSFDEVVVGTGAITYDWQTASVLLSVEGVSGDRALRQSRYIAYVPDKSHYINVSGALCDSYEDIAVVQRSSTSGVEYQTTVGDWTTRIPASNNNWSSVVYGDGLFVSVAYSGTGIRVMTSPNGVTWTSRTTPADNNWYSLTYANNLYVAVAGSGTGNRVMTSPNGITWTLRESAADNDWRNICYGNGLFVAVSITGTGNRVMTSSDGITWDSRTSAADNQWYGICYGNNIFVAVSISGTNNRVMTSPDGITWTSRNAAAENQWRSVTYGNGKFVAVAVSGTGNRVMTSPDGITWTAQTCPDKAWYSVKFAEGLFVAVCIDAADNVVMKSADGITWETMPSPVANQWRDVAYGNGVLVAVATTGTNDRVMTATITETPILNPLMDTKIYQQDWNKDKAPHIDFTKRLVFTIDFQWLGSGNARMGIIDTDGNTLFIHEFFHSNTGDVPYMRTPTLPIRYEITCDDNYTYYRAGYFDDYDGLFFEARKPLASGALREICCSASTEGGVKPVGVQYHANTRLNCPTVGTAGSIVLAVRLSNLQNGHPNRAICVFMGDTSFASSENVIFETYKVTNYTDNGTLWTEVNSLSACEYAAGTNINLAIVEEHILSCSLATGSTSGSKSQANTSTSNALLDVLDENRIIKQNYDSSKSQMYIIKAWAMANTSQAGASLTWIEYE